MQGPIPGDPRGRFQTVMRHLLPTYIPVLGDEGKRTYLDMTYIMPYGDIAEGRGRDYGPLGRLPQQADPTSNPFLSTIFALGMNKDPFTSKEIVRRSDTTGEKFKKSLDYVASEMLPSLTPGFGVTSGGWGYRKLQKAGVIPRIEDGRLTMDPQEDWYGEVLPRDKAILDAIFGLKNRPITPGREYNRRVLDIHREMLDLVEAYRQTLRNPQISEAQKEREGRRFREKMDRLQEQMRFFREEIRPKVPDLP